MTRTTFAWLAAALFVAGCSNPTPAPGGDGGTDGAGSIDLRGVDGPFPDLAHDAARPPDMPTDMAQQDRPLDMSMPMSDLADLSVPHDLTDASMPDFSKLPDLTVVDEAMPDLRMPDLLLPDLRRVDFETPPDLTFVCHSDNDCQGMAGLPRCVSGRCVQCTMDPDCPVKTHCDTKATNSCLPGCDTTAQCPAGTICDTLNGSCVGCLSDSDCTKANMPPRCSPTTHTCTACLPFNDNCPTGERCGTVDAGYACVSTSCRQNQDCPPSDGGAVQVCDTNTGKCVQCVTDIECGAGRICVNDACVPGCSTASPCAAGQCCNATCVNEATDPNNCGACGMACGAGGACCSSTCQNIASDPNNCGACGNKCSVANGVAGCTNGKCVVASCGSGFGDCDGIYSNGCETNLNTSTLHCGTCANACTVANGAGVCNGGSCAIGSCNPGFADCDMQYGTGCEANVSTDDNNCGTCQHVCPASAPVCSGGVCGTSCGNGFVDCGGGCSVDTQNDPNNCGGCGFSCSSANVMTRSCTAGACSSSCNGGYVACKHNLLVYGCDTNVNTDPSNCGGCGVVCSPNNATPSCSAGACTSTCNAGYADCNNALQMDGCETNINTDVNHCGACGTSCSSLNDTPSCTAGKCTSTCNPGFADCNGNLAADGCETNLMSDSNNCGACGTRCPAGISSCVSGVCTCNTGGPVCNGVCPSYASDVNNCGFCGRVCPATATCTNGACVCGSGLTFCDNGGCLNAATDPMNCGGCGAACSNRNVMTLACTNGVCTSTCQPGWANCSGDLRIGCDINTDTNTSHCGGCLTPCSTNNIMAVCAGGSCEMGICSAGFADCNHNKRVDGCETNVLSDNSNCGACGHICAAGTVCQAGACVCPASTPNSCGGGCTNTLTDPNNCGACGTVCPSSATCTNGKCVCSSGKTACGLSCVDLTSDPGNCGTCGKACNMGALTACANGSCACPAPALTCNGSCTNGQTDANNCGSCGNVCPFNATCTSGACICGTGLTACGTRCTSTQTDPTNCGSCGVACSNVNIQSPTCAMGACNGMCNSGWANCDNTKQMNGCNVNLASDVNNCGACAMPCSMNNITAICAGDSCEGGVCNAGFADCNGNKRLDGCEVNLSTDVNHCGGCSLKCSTNNITTPTCQMGICTGACNAGFADCDMNKQSNGCEININTDTNNCGSCGNKCATGQSCVSGVCTCPTGQTLCGMGMTAACVDTTSSVANCGACGHACATGQSCVGSTCVCPTGQTLCGSGASATCVDTNTNVNNCGGCGVACSSVNVTPVCSNGNCNSGVCASGFANCDNTKQANGCNVNTLTDNANCGGCNMPCTASQTCTNGTCM